MTLGLRQAAETARCAVPGSFRGGAASLASLLVVLGLSGQEDMILVSFVAFCSEVNLHIEGSFCSRRLHYPRHSRNPRFSKFPNFPRNLARDFLQYTCERPEMTTQSEEPKKAKTINGRCNPINRPKLAAPGGRRGTANAEVTDKTNSYREGET